MEKFHRRWASGIFSILTVILFSLNAMALDWTDFLRPSPPSRPGGHETCTARDRGHEEHWGGHRSCRDCLYDHGECTYSCSIENFQCYASGVDQNGQQRTFEAYSDYSEYDARDRALERCYGSQLRDCRVVDCQVRSYVTERGRCGGGRGRR